MRKLQPRHKWFSASEKEAEDWYGPHDTVEAAVIEFLSLFQSDYDEGGDITIAIGQGRKTTKAEREEFAVNFGWQIDTPEFFVTVTNDGNKDNSGNKDNL